MVSSVEKPCIKRCCLNEKDVCMGCFRTLDDMKRWYKANRAEKVVMLNHAKEREATHALLHKSHKTFI